MNEQQQSYRSLNVEGIELVRVTLNRPEVRNAFNEVLIHEPAWVSFTEEVKLCYGIPVHIPYSCSVYDYEDFITKKTKMIIINNPTNPTGKVYSKNELNHILKLAKKYNLVINPALLVLENCI